MPNNNRTKLYATLKAKGWQIPDDVANMPIESEFEFLKRLQFGCKVIVAFHDLSSEQRESLINGYDLICSAIYDLLGMNGSSFLEVIPWPKFEVLSFDFQY